MTRGRPGLAGPGLPAWGRAFPARLAEDVRRVAAFVPESRPGPAEPFRVVVTGESVDIPSRVYDEEPGECPGPGPTGTQRLILHCLYSRHHDGHVRQRHLEALLPAAEPWVVPYVIQQAGEYVREIQEAIRRGLPGIAVPHSPQRRLYGAFIVRNAEFFARRRRAHGGVPCRRDGVRGYGLAASHTAPGRGRAHSSLRRSSTTTITRQPAMTSTVSHGGTFSPVC